MCLFVCQIGLLSVKGKTNYRFPWIFQPNFKWWLNGLVVDDSFVCKVLQVRMADELAKNNLFFDYLYNLRLLDPDLSAETNDLKEKSAEYIDS